MNRTIIVSLSSFGLVMGLLSVKSYTQKVEPLPWLLAGIAAALVLSKSISNKVFLHALCVGLLWGVLNGIFQSFFLINI
jgi:hypothetical protein